MASVYEHTLIFNKSSLEKFIALIKKNCVMRKDMYNLESDLVPRDDHTYNIGAGDKRWKEIYGNNLYITSYDDGNGGRIETQDLVVKNPVTFRIGNSLEHKLYSGEEPNIHISIKELFSGDTSGGESADIVANDILKGEFTSEGQFKYSPYANKTEGTNSNNANGFYFYVGSEDPSNGDNRLNLNGSFRAYKVYSAVFNDYAELRESTELEPGRCVVEDGQGQLHRSTQRLMAGANIISDTYGMLIGEGEAPIAVCGRVLAYPGEGRLSYVAGDAVCAGENGTISKMTRDEIKEYPDRIVGYVSEIPSYEYWGSDNVPVKGRIWIKVN